MPPSTGTPGAAVPGVRSRASFREDHGRPPSGEDVYFVPVRVIPDDTPHASIATPVATLELVLGSGRRLRISIGFDEPTLRRLLVLLEEGRS